MANLFQRVSYNSLNRRGGRSVTANQRRLRVKLTNAAVCDPNDYKNIYEPKYIGERAKSISYLNKLMNGKQFSMNGSYMDEDVKRLDLSTRSAHSSRMDNSHSQVLSPELLLMREQQKMEKWQKVKENKEKVIEDALSKYSQKKKQELERQRLIQEEQRYLEEMKKKKKEKDEKRRQDVIENLKKLEKQKRREMKQLENQLNQASNSQSIQSKKDVSRTQRKYVHNALKEQLQLNARKYEENLILDEKLKQFQAKISNSDKIAEKYRQARKRAASLEKDKVQKANQKYEKLMEEEFVTKIENLHSKIQKIKQIEEEKTKTTEYKTKKQRELLLENENKLKKQKRKLELKEKRKQKQFDRKSKEKETKNSNNIFKDQQAQERNKMIEERNKKKFEQCEKYQKVKDQYDQFKKNVIHKHMKIGSHVEWMKLCQAEIIKIRHQNAEQLRQQGLADISNPYEYLPNRANSNGRDSKLSKSKQSINSLDL